MGDQERIDISATKQGNGGRATKGSSQGDHEGRPLAYPLIQLPPALEV
jgi:hypothetical protein